METEQEFHWLTGWTDTHNGQWEAVMAGSSKCGKRQGVVTLVHKLWKW